MIGSHHISLDTVDSTNLHARELLREGAAEGTVVSALHQTAGRGRKDRSWTDRPGQNLLASYMLKPKREPAEWGGVPLMTGLAALRALRGFVPLDIHLKWPNDVFVGDRKIAGILTESVSVAGTSWIIAGIGINLNQTEFDGTYRHPPTSLLLESGRPCDPNDMLTALSKELDVLYGLWQKQGNPPVLDLWKQQTRMLGARVHIEEEGQIRTATAIGISGEGALVVRADDGKTEQIFAGDVSIAVK